MSRLRAIWRALGGARSLPFWGVHVATVAGIALTGWSWTGLALALALYFGRMFFVTAGYHRYFSHRSFKAGRAVQLALAVGATLSLQKGVLWWAANHRLHHRYSDGQRDIHSPVQRGFWWSHLGWILADDHAETRWEVIPDFARYPELRWLNRHYLVPPIVLAAVLFLAGGWWALLWAFFVSTTLLWHGTFLVNSLAHVLGRRRYATKDASRNNLAIALVTMGEGWHNNHHRYAASARQGFFWWEADLTYYVLLALRQLGLIWDLRAPPGRVLDEGRRRRTMTDDVAARVTAARGILKVARDKLDAEVAALPDGAADNAMATPTLLALLIRVVEARRHLDGLELLLARTQAT